MKWIIRLSKILLILLIFSTSNVFADNNTNKTPSRRQENYTLDTMYDAVCYRPKEPETYNVDLYWDDLHISFASNDSNTSNLSNNQLDAASILVKNNSKFFIDVLGTIKENDKKSNSNYVRLEIASCTDNCEKNNLYYSRNANVSNLSNGIGMQFMVRPMLENTQKYNNGIIVTENVKLIISKSN